MGSQKCIFIVDDNEIYSMMLDYILSKDSVYKFVSFNSGEECIKNLYLNPDIIILDYGLPQMNGHETLLKIKKSHPNIHVVILTENTNPALAVQLFKAGADDYILKQGNGETQVIEKIEDILNKEILQKSKINGFNKKLAYGALIVALLILAFYYYKF